MTTNRPTQSCIFLTTTEDVVEGAETLAADFKEAVAIRRELNLLNLHDLHLVTFAIVVADLVTSFTHAGILRSMDQTL